MLLGEVERSMRRYPQRNNLVLLFYPFVWIRAMWQSTEEDKTRRKANGEVYGLAISSPLVPRCLQVGRVQAGSLHPHLFLGKVFPVSLPGSQARVCLTGPCVGAGCQHPSLSEPCWDGACSLQCISNPHGEHSGWVLKADWGE